MICKNQLNKLIRSSNALSSLRAHSLPGKMVYPNKLDGSSPWLPKFMHWQHVMRQWLVPEFINLEGNSIIMFETMIAKQVNYFETWDFSEWKVSYQIINANLHKLCICFIHLGKYVWINTSTACFFGRLGIAPSWVMHRKAAELANLMDSLKISICSSFGRALKPRNIF